MILYSFSGIISSVFFIFIVYVLFSQQINNRSKIILIILLFIIGITLFMNLDMFQNYNRLISNVSDATQTTTIPKNTIIKGSGNYSISTWVYVDDWNYKFGEKKTIIKRDNLEKKSNPHIYLDSYKNDITVEFTVKPANADVSDNYVGASQWCEENSEEISTEVMECNYDTETNNYIANRKGATCNKSNNYECLDGTAVELDNIECDHSVHKATVKNIPIQKWFNVIYGFGDNHTDIYLNGKLVKTKTFNGLQFTESFENNDFIICPDGGYSGSISKTSYYNELLSPQKAWDIYKDGFSSVVVGSLFSKYNASVTFYEDTNERAKYYIV